MIFDSKAEWFAFAFQGEFKKVEMIILSIEMVGCHGPLMLDIF